MNSFTFKTILLALLLVIIPITINASGLDMIYEALNKDNSNNNSPLQMILNILNPKKETPKPPAVKPAKIKPASPKKKRINIDTDVAAEKFNYTGSFKNDIAGNKKLINKGDSLEEIERNTETFALGVSRRASATIDAEESKHLDELVANTYYPAEAVDERSESDMVVSSINFV